MAELQIAMFELAVTQVAGPITAYLKPQSYASTDEFVEAMDKAFRSWAAVRDSVQVRLLQDFKERGVFGPEFFDAATDSYHQREG